MTHLKHHFNIMCILALISCPLLFAAEAYGQVVAGYQKIPGSADLFGEDITMYGRSIARSVANIGDLDGDGITDVAVGEKTENGVVWILFLNADGTVARQRKIRNREASQWGTSIAYVGDLDGDGAPEIAVGAPGDFSGGERGAVWVLSLNANGSVKKRVKIDGSTFQGGAVGMSLAGIGDLDGDGIPDLAVGRIDPTNLGDVLILFLNADASVKTTNKFSLDENPSGGETGFQQFGWSMASIGDLDGDGVTDLVVGKPLDNDGADEEEYFKSRGAVIVAFLNADGTLKSYQKISDTEGQFAGEINDFDRFGRSVAHLGDFGESGVTYIAVGAVAQESQAPSNTVWILRVNQDGTANAHVKIDENTAGLGPLIGGDFFGDALASLGDLDGNGVVDIMVGAPGDDEAGENAGAAWTLFLGLSRIGALTLIDAAADLPIEAFDPLQYGAALDLDDLPIHLNVRAHAAGSVESVRFEFKGDPNFRTESVGPYALFGDTNGDFANGSLQPGTYTLTAVPYTEDYGLGEAGMSRTIEFSVTGNVPEGLVLWNTLGSDEEVLHSKVGPDLSFYTGGGGLEVAGDAAYVPGAFGNGVTLAGQYGRSQRVHNIVLDNANQYIDPERGTVEAWYKQDVDPVANAHNIWRVFGGGFGLGSGMAFQSFDGDFDDRQRFIIQLAFGGTSTQVYSIETGFDGYNISPYNGQWIHLAGVWDRAGIDGTDDTIQLYLNGMLVASTTETGWGTQVGHQIEICGANDDSAGLFAMDNLKLWNYAKTDFSDRFVEGNSEEAQMGGSVEVSNPETGNALRMHPETISLEENYPNPFNPTTTIPFSLQAQGEVELVVYDMLGRKVRTLVDGMRAAGVHRVVFEAGDLPSGIYLYRLRTPTGQRVRQMLLMK